jgi:hypothetical protein
MLRTFWFLAGLALMACGGSGDDDDSAAAMSSQPVCEAGRVVECPCADQTMGTQTCAKDGLSWGACECPMPDPMQSDPMVACKDPVKPTDVAPFRCDAPRSAIWGWCEKTIIDAGTCVAKGSLFCCPPPAP